MKSFLAFLALIFIFTIKSESQDLLNLLDEEQHPKEYVSATFKSTRVINGQSVMNPPKGELIFLISHRFGLLNGGPYEFFGLDQAFMRLGFEYGLTDRLAIGIGRSIYQKTYDGFLKYAILKQSTGSGSMPVSVSYFTSVSLNSLKWDNPDRENLFSSRLGYTHQVLIARKFSNDFSLQISPTLVHRNLVPTALDQNDVFAIGVGARYKLTQRLSLNIEYFYLLPGKTADDFYNSFSVGVDLETGGHVFQLHFTNSLGMFEKAFVTETTGDWLNGDIHFGFNISRVFSIVE